MNTIAFYSYKGGVGRTKLMLATALKLAKDGSNVAILDLDDDAPSVLDIFGDTQEDIGERELLHLLFNPSTEDKDVIEAKRDKTDFLKQIYPDAKGNLSYIPTINYEDFRHKMNYNESNFIRNLKQIFRIFAENNINYILIDTRPGVSSSAKEVSGMVDDIIFVTRLDVENFNGIKRYAKRIIDRESTKLIANLVPNTDDEEINKLIQEKSDSFSKNLKAIDSFIDYSPKFALDSGYGFLKDIENTSFENGINWICKEIK